ncbi:MAG: peptidoglycan-binding protein [Oscillospiraceae bacterium]|nr:peptidoglycan-binding protein [Oscillospiraceae bacterium]
MNSDHPQDSVPIGELQEMLRTLAPDGAPFEEGVYGTHTQKAVERFQRTHGIPVTGVVDAETWSALKRAYENEIVDRQPATPLDIIMQPHQVMEKGCDNTNIYLVQAMIKALSRYIPDLPAVDVTGRLDAKTEQAIKWLQACCGLPKSGDIDKNTWRFLAHEYRSMVGDGTGAFPVRHLTPPPIPRQ